jgi:uncharacterized protein YdhG (YjbR/CyaY superfamily)
LERKRAGFNSIDDYIASFPKEAQKILETLRREIKASAPDAEEKITYGIPTFFLNGNLVHFAAFENHIGFYPTPGGIQAFKRELSVYKSAKGSVQFPIDQPLPLKLIGRIVKFRAAENRMKARVKLKRKK